MKFIFTESWHLNARIILGHYTYNLTPANIEAKLHLTYRFLKRRLKEYTEIKAQLQTLICNYVRTTCENVLQS